MEGVFVCAGVMQEADIWDLKSRFWGFESLHPHHVPEAKGERLVCKTSEVG